MKNLSKLVLLLAIMLSGCSETKKDTTEITVGTAIAEPYQLQQTVYYGGDIITMAGDNPSYVEAVVQREGKIIFTGSKADALAQFDGKAD